jgi:hypothetical protein
MKQQSLFTNPIARKSDPKSSHLAASEITRSGVRESQCETILDVLACHPWTTSRELTLYCDLDRYQIARRLPDLENAGLVRKGFIRKCRIGGRKSVTWFKITN